jgi:hypothetical protein
MDGVALVEEGERQSEGVAVMGVADYVLEGLLDEVDEVVAMHPECKVDGDSCQACHLRRILVEAAGDARRRLERERLLFPEART